MTPGERFLCSVEVQSNGCWLWRGSPEKRGYGRFYMNGNHNVRAHRAAYVLFRGEIPAGMLVCHSCDNPGCVNPAHLWLGTGSDNMRDMVAKGRGRFHYGLRAHCEAGHPFTPENTYQRSEGGRRCRECKNARERDRYARHKGAA